MKVKDGTIKAPLLIGAVIVSLLVAFKPFWETNDDVAGSMIAHGYGIAGVASPSLLISNVCWGWFLQLIPSIGGVLPYSYVWITVIFLSGCAIFSSLRRMGCETMISLLAVTVILIRPIASPQFTVVAGLAGVAGVVVWISYFVDKRRLWLVAGSLFLFIAYLIRSQELLFVLIVVSPLIPWRAMIRDKNIKIATAALVAIVAGAHLLNWQYYQKPEWATFNSRAMVLRDFTDFNVNYYLKMNPRVLLANGYSSNDLSLITNWFFDDPAITDPVRLQQLWNSIDTSKRIFANVRFGVSALAALSEPQIAPLILSATVFGLISPYRIKFLAMLGLFMACIFTYGLLGRPAVLRTYYPIVSLLLISSMFRTVGFNPIRPSDLTAAKGAKLRERPIFVFSISVLLLAIGTAGFHHYTANRAAIERLKITRTDISQLDRNELYVVMGGDFPYESAYPAIDRDKSIRTLNLYATGTSSLAPFAKARWEGRPWSGLIDQLLHGPPLPFIANEYHISLLKTYCLEHHSRELRVTRQQVMRSFTVSYLTCASN